MMAPAVLVLHAFTLLFTGLKLCGVIGWSWWLVTLPSWGPIAACLAVALVAVIFYGLWYLFTSKEERAMARAAQALDDYRDALRGRRG